MSQNVIPQLEEAMDKTVSLLSSLTEQQLNTVPFEGSWTAAQVGRHLYKAQKGSDAMFLQPTDEPDRGPGERIPNYKEILLDYEHKMNSPEFILPEDINYNKEQLISALKDLNKEMMPALNKANLNQNAIIPEENPLKGSTKLEIVHFMLYHTIRHNHQIEKIKEALVY